MKTIGPLLYCVGLLLFPGIVWPHSSQFDARLQQALCFQGTDDYLTTPDKFGTPRIIQLARQGDMPTLLAQASFAKNGAFLLAQDKYGNNIFHVAHDVRTVHTLAALVRQFFGSSAAAQLHVLANARNRLGETPLHAQINAGHTDTFRPIYTQTTLKQKNDHAKNQLARLHGMDEQIIAQQKAIYCQEITTLSMAQGQTLLQSAQALARVHPTMQHLAQEIRREIPCLSAPFN